MAQYLRGLQDKICAAFAQEDGRRRFREDQWEYAPGSGGGRSRVLSAGAVFEKCGANFSDIAGPALPDAASARHPELAAAPFRALGLSLVSHPRNPYVPACHLNLRFLETRAAARSWWFGGGYDLSPCYGFVEDCRHWHRTAERACRPFGAERYARYKRWCDEYFYLPHRKEARGVGGLFFDDLSEGGFARCFAFVRSVGDSFLEAYLPIVARRKEQPYGQRQRRFQLYRRGRYAEFNLVQDRGTRFGLQSGGRVESILMSLPPLARWEYNWRPTPGTPEAALYQDFLPPQDWL